jgi:hypothetical protein
MSQFALTKPLKNHDPICDDLMAMAERELAAFFNAVAELFGLEQAEISAENWLHELTTMHDLPASICEWRQLTVKVSARLASRVNAPCTSAASRTLAYSD